MQPTVHIEWSSFGCLSPLLPQLSISVICLTPTFFTKAEPVQTQILDAIINNNGGDTIGNCQYIKIQTWLIDLGE